MDKVVPWAALVELFATEWNTDLTAACVGNFLPHPALGHLRALEHIGQVVDVAARYADIAAA
jgi:hypothetical protein